MGIEIECFGVTVQILLTGRLSSPAAQARVMQVPVAHWQAEFACNRQAAALPLGIWEPTKLLLNYYSGDLPEELEPEGPGIRESVT